MKTWCATLLFAFALSSAHPAAATDFQFYGVRIAIPEEFTGPVRASPSSRAETVAFSSLHGSGAANNVVQLTRYDLGQPIRLTTTDESFEAASKYLLEMLRGIERRRTSYTQTSPEMVRLGGNVGARAAWKGQLNGAAVNGVMYSFMTGSQAIFLHAFGPGDAPDSQLLRAIRAIEALQSDV